MRYCNLILILGVCLLINSCVKREVRPVLDASSSLAAQARKYFTDSVQSVSGVFESYPAKIPKRIYWEQASPVSLPIGRGVAVPVQYAQPLFIKSDFAGDHFFNLDNLSQLLVYKDALGHFHAEVLTWMPDSTFLRDPTQVFSGLLFVDDWQGNSLSRWLYSKGGVHKYHASNTQAATIIRTCNYIYGYNYASGDPGGGYSWVQAGGCYYMYLPDRADYGDGRGGFGAGMNGGGGVGGGGRSVAIAPPDNPIANIVDYFKCFTNAGGNDHQYTVTICVDQPIPGTRTPWTPVDGGPIGSSNAGNMVDVGHTFLIFSETYGGTTITRNVGFYPTGMVNPAFRSSQGKLNNDEGHTYNISATFTVTNAQFFTMLIYSERGNVPGFVYNLNTENCTSYALHTLSQGGIFLPSTISSWLNGMGNDPGDLGEDIRQMTPLPNMTKNTVENFHPNMGSCN